MDCLWTNIERPVWIYLLTKWLCLPLFVKGLLNRCLYDLFDSGKLVVGYSIPRLFWCLNTFKCISKTVSIYNSNDSKTCSAVGRWPLLCIGPPTLCSQEFFRVCFQAMKDRILQNIISREPSLVRRCFLIAPPEKCQVVTCFNHVLVNGIIF